LVVKKCWYHFLSKFLQFFAKINFLHQHIKIEFSRKKRFIWLILFNTNNFITKNFTIFAAENLNKMIQYFKGIFTGLKSLVMGMWVTLKVFFRKKVTEQYPENRKTLQISDRWRAELTMPHDENNEHACTACGICQMNCPNGTIQVISQMIESEDGKKKRILDKYIYDLGLCTFCNLCVITCPSQAIEFSNHFENAVFTRPKLVEQLNHEGSKLRK
jgi:NADH-quinone oxidoreductase subunit I